MLYGRDMIKNFPNPDCEPGGLTMGLYPGKAFKINDDILITYIGRSGNMIRINVQADINKYKVLRFSNERG